MHSETLPEDMTGGAPIEGDAAEVLADGQETSAAAAPGLDSVDLQPLAGDIAAGLPSTDLAPVADVPVELVVEIGRTKMSIGETLSLGPGSVVSLDKQTGEPVDLLVNGTPIARGEVIAVDEEFGIRLTEVLPPERRLDATSL
ncbi:MAG: flagellar motor switch protein FliN [Gaiellaceae bacterium]